MGVTPRFCITKAQLSPSPDNEHRESDNKPCCQDQRPVCQRDPRSKRVTKADFVAWRGIMAVFIKCVNFEAVFSRCESSHIIRFWGCGKRYVIIHDDVEIGANCTIDRATMGETIIHKGTKLDNLIHIAHNVEVGESTVMAAQVGISGSTKIGHHVMLGGQLGTVGHITIGNYVQVAAQSGVSKSIPDKEVYFGTPARPIMRTKRIEAVVNQLPELLKRVIRLFGETC